MAMFRLPPHDRARRQFVLSKKADEEIRQIAAAEGRSDVEAARLLMRLGLRAYKQRRSLLCDYINCSRKDCCGGDKPRGVLVDFPSSHS